MDLFIRKYSLFSVIGPTKKEILYIYIYILSSHANCTGFIDSLLLPITIHHRICSFLSSRRHPVPGNLMNVSFYRSANFGVSIEKRLLWIRPSLAVHRVSCLSTKVCEMGGKWPYNCSFARCYFLWSIDFLLSTNFREGGDGIILFKNTWTLFYLSSCRVWFLYLPASSYAAQIQLEKEYSREAPDYLLVSAGHCQLLAFFLVLNHFLLDLLMLVVWDLGRL